MLTPGFPIAAWPPHRPAIIDTLAELHARHHTLEVHALRPPPDAPGEHRYRGLPVVGYGAGSKLGRFAALARRVLRDADREPVEVVWGLWVDRTGPAALALGALLGAPVVLSVMGGELADLPELAYGYARGARRRATLAALLTGATRVTLGSEALLAPLARVAPAVLAKARVTPLGAPRPVRDQAPAARGRLALVAIADLSPIKRPELLVRVLRALRDRGLDVHLDLYGDGTPERAAHVERLATELGVRGHLHLAGFVPPEVLRALLGAYDVLVHTSAHESQGCALVEAALAGLPIATTDVGVARELERLGAAIAVADAPLVDPFVHAVRAAADRAPPSRAAQAALAARYGLEGAAAALARVLEEASG